MCLSKLATLVAVITILVLGIDARSQTLSDREGGCLPDSNEKVRVTLISVSKRYKLTRGVPISVTVRAENCSSEPVVLSVKPSFEFLREGVSENAVRGGDKYYGGVAEDWPKANSPVCLKPNSIREFYVDVAALEVKDLMSSIDLWDTLFTALTKGEFGLRGSISLANLDPDGREVEFWSSNKIVIVKED